MDNYKGSPPKGRRGSDIIRSRRAGSSSLDNKSIERAEWYNKLQDEIFAKLHEERLLAESKELDEADDSLLITEASRPTTRATTAGTETMTEEEIAELKAQEEAEKEELMKQQKEALLKKMMEDRAKQKKQFSGGMTMQLANESDTKRKEDEERRNAVGKIKRPDPEYYTRPPDFNPERWIINLTPVVEIHHHQSPPPIKARLLICPWICGDAMVFKSLANELIKYQIEVYAVQLPGRSIRYNEPLVKTVFQVTHNIMTALDELHMLNHDLPPLVLYGHNVGALIAFDLVRLLFENYNADDVVDASGHHDIYPIKHLIVSGCNPPHIVTKLNSDRFETKYFCASGGELQQHLIKRDLVPVFLKDRKDIMNLYIELCRADLVIFEKYILWQEDDEKDDKDKRGSRLGGGNENKDVKPECPCPLTTLIAKDDPNVNIHTVVEWLRHCTIDEVRKEYLPFNENDLDDEDDMSVGSSGKPRKKHAWERPIPESNKYYKLFKSGGHMFIRDKVNKKFNSEFIEYVKNICIGED